MKKKETIVAYIVLIVFIIIIGIIIKIKSEKNVSQKINSENINYNDVIGILESENKIDEIEIQVCNNVSDLSEDEFVYRSKITNDEKIINEIITTLKSAIANSEDFNNAESIDETFFITQDDTNITNNMFSYALETNFENCPIIAIFLNNNEAIHITAIDSQNESNSIFKIWKNDNEKNSKIYKTNIKLQEYINNMYQKIEVN